MVTDYGIQQLMTPNYVNRCKIWSTTLQIISKMEKVEQMDKLFKTDERWREENDNKRETFKENDRKQDKMETRSNKIIQNCIKWLWTVYNVLPSDWRKLYLHSIKKLRTD